jgi:hypothetical protein
LANTKTTKYCTFFFDFQKRGLINFNLYKNSYFSTCQSVKLHIKGEAPGEEARQSLGFFFSTGKEKTGKKALKFLFYTIFAPMFLSISLSLFCLVLAAVYVAGLEP